MQVLRKRWQNTDGYQMYADEELDSVVTVTSIEIRAQNGLLTVQCCTEAWILECRLVGVADVSGLGCVGTASDLQTPT